MVERANPSTFFGESDDKTFYAFILGLIFLGLILLAIVHYSRR